MFKKNQSIRSIVAIMLVCMMVFGSFAGVGTVEASVKAPKYVFYFIGDGLGAAQRQLAEYYSQELNGNKEKLLINNLPVAGINTTHSASSFVTDSAAAGTALATGHKTNNAMISVLPDGKTEVKTLIECAEAKGMATGLASTTRITHATPAAFGAHNVNRDDENGVADDYLTSGIDFMVGGGYRHFVPAKWEWGKSKRKDDKNLVTEFSKKGYNTFVTEKRVEAFRNYQPNGKEKVFAAFTYTHLPYEIERVQNNATPSLAEITKKGIDVLSKYEKGFFFAIEGGRIDHACHANDAPSTIGDTLAFNNAVKEAYEFYKKHPNETLIVVVGDHETGGLGIGFSINYFMKPLELKDVKVSVEDTLTYGKSETVYEKGEDREVYIKYLSDKFNLKDLTEAEKAEIEKAMDLIDSGVKIEKSLYYGYNPVAITATHILSKRANINWTTYAHSGTAIPMSAIGVGAEKFAGYKDNTEIAKTMASVMGFTLSK